MPRPFHFPSSNREERFGKAKFGAAWEERQSETELTLLGYIHNYWDDWRSALDGAPVGGPPAYLYREPQGQYEAAQKAVERARKREAQLASVRRMLRLLDRYGPGSAPQPGTRFRSDYDPLEQIYSGDDPNKLDEARDLYWRIHFEGLTETEVRTKLIPDFTHMADDDLERFRSWLVRRRTDQNGYPLADDMQLIPLDDLKVWIDPDCLCRVRDVHGVKVVLASDILSKLAVGWRPSLPQNKSPEVRAELERAYAQHKNGTLAPQRESVAYPKSELKQDIEAVFEAIESGKRPAKAWKVKPRTRLTATESAVLDAVNALWPMGELDHKAKARDTRINGWLKQNNQSSASKRTIQRSLKKIRFA